MNCTERCFYTGLITGVALIGVTTCQSLANSPIRGELIRTRQNLYAITDSLDRRTYSPREALTLDESTLDDIHDKLHKERSLQERIESLEASPEYAAENAQFRKNMTLPWILGGTIIVATGTIPFYNLWKLNSSRTERDRNKL